MEAAGSAEEESGKKRKASYIVNVTAYLSIHI